MNNEIGAYEQLRLELEYLSFSTNSADRHTLWVVDRIFGIAKTASGSIELFLVGDRLKTSTSLVRRHLEYGRWQIAENSIFIDSNRLVLPSGAHFLPIAAMIGVELVRFGLTSASRLQDAFRNVEPLIDLALRQSALADEHIIGLVGELLCLEVMIDAVITKPTLRSAVLDMWRGHSSGLRDFVIGGIAIEIKTTQSESSSHKFSGLHQVEPSSKSGINEQALLLLSFGLSISESEGQSLPEIVQRIYGKLSTLPENIDDKVGPLQDRFLSNIAQYGSENVIGYDHRTMSDEKIYNVRFHTTFSPRLYDLTDNEIKILRCSDLQNTCVSKKDFQFRLDLPAFITQTNPFSNWAITVTELVRTELM